MHLIREKIELDRLPLPPEGGEGRVRGDFHSGAEVVYIGKVRDHSQAGSQRFRHARENSTFSSSQGRKVLFLEYEAYEFMAENLIENLIEEAKNHWKVGAVSVLHRLGKVALGEIAVLIKAESAHRDEAYQASRFLIEEIKHKVPIWKKEYFTDGTAEWSLCRHEPNSFASS